MIPLILTIAVAWGIAGALWWGWHVDRYYRGPYRDTGKAERGVVALAGGPLIWLLLSGVWWADRRVK